MSDAKELVTWLGKQGIDAVADGDQVISDRFVALVIEPIDVSDFKPLPKLEAAILRAHDLSLDHGGKIPVVAWRVPRKQWIGWARMYHTHLVKQLSIGRPFMSLNAIYEDWHGQRLGDLLATWDLHLDKL